jgi:hypothetical protein
MLWLLRESLIIIIHGLSSPISSFNCITLNYTHTPICVYATYIRVYRPGLCCYFLLGFCARLIPFRRVENQGIYHAGWALSRYSRICKPPHLSLRLSLSHSLCQHTAQSLMYPSTTSLLSLDCPGYIVYT